MNWAQVSIVFFVSHLAGDYLLQTDWQARRKFGGLGSDSVARRALLSHVLTYTAAFVPALIWIADQTSVVDAAVIGLLIAAPHLVVDDGRLLAVYMRAVKHCTDPPPPGLLQAVDQSFHLIMLWLAALVVSVLS